MAGQKTSVRHWPRITRFYGIGPAELKRMPNVLIEHYVDMIRELEAEETLLNILVSDMPHMEQADRKKVRRQLARYAGIKENVAAIDTTTESGRQLAGSLGIGVPTVPAGIESKEDDHA